MENAQEIFMIFSKKDLQDIDESLEQSFKDGKIHTQLIGEDTFTVDNIEYMAQVIIRPVLNKMPPEDKKYKVLDLNLVSMSNTIKQEEDETNGKIKNEENNDLKTPPHQIINSNSLIPPSTPKKKKTLPSILKRRNLENGRRKYEEMNEINKDVDYLHEKSCKRRLVFF